MCSGFAYLAATPGGKASHGRRGASVSLGVSHVRPRGALRRPRSSASWRRSTRRGPAATCAARSRRCACAGGSRQCSCRLPRAPHGAPRDTPHCCARNCVPCGRCAGAEPHVARRLPAATWRRGRGLHHEPAMVSAAVCARVEDCLVTSRTSRARARSLPFEYTKDGSLRNLTMWPLNAALFPNTRVRRWVGVHRLACVTRRSSRHRRALTRYGMRASRRATSSRRSSCTVSHRARVTFAPLHFVRAVPPLAAPARLDNWMLGVTSKIARMRANGHWWVA